MEHVWLKSFKGFIDASEPPAQNRCSIFQPLFNHQSYVTHRLFLRPVAMGDIFLLCHAFYYMND